ncbi:hypothetical protein L7F22_050658 [Adiantum nelumboides]|nr:hypothetical protein [Adiantum nelumboides]
MSHPALSLQLQKPLLIFVLLIIDLSLVARAMRMYPSYASPAGWRGHQKQDTDIDGSRQQHRFNLMESAAGSASHRQSTMMALVSQYHQMDRQSLHSIHSDCISHRSTQSAPSPSSQDTHCLGSPAPEDAEGSEIDPRYGVEKRLVPTGPNPLHN